MSQEHTNPFELPTHPTLLHPRTGAPLRAVGVLPSGRIVWPIMGGDGSEADANDTADKTGDSGEDADKSTETDDTDKGGDDSEDDDTSDEDKRVQKANKEAQRYRTELRDLQKEQQSTKDLLARLTKALTGEDSMDAPADPKELASKIDTLTETVSTQAVHLAVFSLAPAAGGNAVALLDSRSFTDSLKGLDPATDADKITKAIKDAVTKNAAYRLTQGSGRGGGDIDADQAEKPKGKQLGLHDAIAARLGGKK